MSRVTIMLDEHLELKLRNIQAKTIKDTGRTFSFSACINETLERGLK